eukprot:NODE_2671_length_1522_cov_45.386705_g2301_i0.p1 GENE.NODE_2671_length_1522_cov_45.386705_g2301_i0~~NODE_2671_length_1522_cov_45.386705_g2301_i0.p1  ORF type:complete len:472 (-),score=81.05 NODE_2671_length_1522_cov_45.386705_g2301_i0:105-1367(-)
MLPLGGGGIRKPWGKSNQDFPCCWGTLSESFAKLADSIYFRSPDNSVVYINQFVSSYVVWTEKSITIQQSAGFPDSTSYTTIINVKGNGNFTKSTFSIKIRVPFWAITNQNTISVNGVPIEPWKIQPGNYLEIYRNWVNGDQIHVYYPMTFWSSPIQDGRPEWFNTMAFMYGPLVLAGITNDQFFQPKGNSTEPNLFFTRTSATALTFKALGKINGIGDYQYVDFIPLFSVMLENYTVYFHTGPLSTVNYSPQGALVPSTRILDIMANYPATLALGPRDAGCTGNNIRSGDPEQTTTVVFAHPIDGQGHNITSITFQYRYIAGYTPQVGQIKKASTLSFVVLKSDLQTPISTLYTSPPLGKYSYDNFTQYSPIYEIQLDNLNIPNQDPVFLSFRFVDNQRNLQIPIDDKWSGFNINVKWS